MATFNPHNDLEQKLLNAQEGRMDSAAFMRELMSAQVFLPVRDNDKHGIKHLQTSSNAQPLSLKTEDGADVLVLFTSPERAKAFLSDYPGYEGGILTDIPWIIERMGTGFGISLNPDQEVGIDMEPEMIQQLASTHV